MTNRSIPDSHNSYYLETYGCQMNFAESNAIEQALMQAGMKPAASAEQADCVIINTCSVRKTAENRIWGRIGFFKHVKETHPLTLVIVGCMAERIGEQLLKDAPAVDLVLGTNDKQRIAAILSGASIDSDEHYSFTESYYKPGEIRSYVPIMNGCNNFCAYCIVPYVRGREVSRSVESIVEEIDRLESLGVRDITLLGQNVNSYHYIQKGINYRFPELLDTIVAHCSAIRWIRFDSPHPKDFSSDLVSVIARYEQIAKHFHIPMQSGSTRILNLMNRKYDRQRYLDLIESIRNACTDATFTTDVMVGFPGETRDDFEETLSVMQSVRFLEAFMYYFNPREGTKAVTMEDQVPAKTRMDRLAELIACQRTITQQEKQARCHRIVDVLVEGPSKRSLRQYLGRTEHDEMVVFEKTQSTEPGELIKVELQGLKGNTYTATIVAEAGSNACSD
ncbi:MAG: tRNA (N6-isopentenyl adenosine(37)-C2)-methylthiotransferase MiaB [Sphaerochaetaceae bacterium]